MLIQFTVENYKCFREEARLSMVASALDKNVLYDENTFYVDRFKLRLLRSATIYGANASGKTKLLDALAFMRRFVVNSSKEGQIDQAIPVDPFRLNTETARGNSVFEIIFLVGEKMYRYGFELNAREVVAEWLYRKVNVKEVQLMYWDREEEEPEINYREFKVRDLVKNKRVRPNALLLSVAASFNDEVAKEVVSYLNLYNVISGINQEGYEGLSVMKLMDERGKQQVLRFLESADLAIEDLKHDHYDLKSFTATTPEAMRAAIQQRARDGNMPQLYSQVSTVRTVYDENLRRTGNVEFSLEHDESAGTRKYFAISGPIIDALATGSVLVIDEMANKLHATLADRIVSIFNNPATNPRNAQLIFNTHDTNMMRPDLLRRDQVWFTKKDRYGAVTLYSLAGFKADQVRKGDDYEKKYLEGRFGGLPYLNTFQKNVKEIVDAVT